MVKWPFRGLSELQLWDKKGYELNHLEHDFLKQNLKKRIHKSHVLYVFGCVFLFDLNITSEPTPNLGRSAGFFLRNLEHFFVELMILPTVG